jgi:hypothetical protein
MPAAGSVVTLSGVVAAAEGRAAYAVVVLDGKDILAVRRGEEIAPGTRLVAVAADHVEIERNGARETLALPEKAGTPDVRNPRKER